MVEYLYLANFIALSRSFGVSGSSADAPSIILNSPSIAKNTDAFLPRKNSKSCVDALLGFGKFITPEPVPENALAEKSNEFPVMVSIDVTESVAPVTFEL